MAIKSPFPNVGACFAACCWPACAAPRGAFPSAGRRTPISGASPGWTAKTSIYVGSVTMHLTPFLRKGANFHANYTAKVFPYFFWNESGWIAIEVPDDALRLLAKGEVIQFKGHGFNDEGEERHIEGRVVPADANSGKIKVRVFVSKRIQLIFNTTYRLAP